MLRYATALVEAQKRFPNSPSRQLSFMEGWRGLKAKRKFGREKYREEFGCGRRRKRLWA